jgi:hypothetical protein
MADAPNTDLRAARQFPSPYPDLIRIIGNALFGDVAQPPLISAVGYLIAYALICILGL